MSQTTDLEIGLISFGQEQKETVANEAFAAFEAKLKTTYTVDLTSETSPFTIPYDVDEGGDKTALRFLRAVFTGEVSEPFDVEIPANREFFVAINATEASSSGGDPQTITIKVAGESTGVEIPNGKARMLYVNGTTVEHMQIDMQYTIDDIADLEAGLIEIFEDIFLPGTNISFDINSAGIVTINCDVKSLADLSDIALSTGLASGDILRYNGTDFVNTPFAEAVDDRVNGLLVAGSNITLTYNDVANTLTIDSTGGGAGDLDDLTDVVITGVASGDMLRYNGSNFVNVQPVAAHITDFAEAVDDRVNALLVAGTDITLTYNDVGNTLTIDSTGGAGDLDDISDVTITTPASGDRLYYNGSAWVNGREPFDICSFYPGEPTASAFLQRFIAGRAITLPTSLTGSYAKAAVAATATTDFDITKNGSSVGTISFAAAATTATFTFASPVSLAVGDILAIIAPASPDATCADISITLVGTR